MIYRMRRNRGTGVEASSTKAPPTQIDSVLSELKSLREEMALFSRKESKSKKRKQEIESLRSQLADLMKPTEKIEEQTRALEVMAQDSANSISKYVSSILARGSEYLTSHGYSAPDSKDELSKTLKSFYSEYKEWCSENNENIMKNSSVDSYIRDGHISGMRLVTVRGYKMLKVKHEFVMSVDDE